MPIDNDRTFRPAHGDRVRIINAEKYGRRGSTLQGATGTLEKIYLGFKAASPYGVRVDNELNAYSSEGLFWFSLDDLAPYDNNTTAFEEENDMDRIAATGYPFIVEAHYLNDNNCPPKTYRFACYDTVNAGDLVLVQPANHPAAVGE